MTADLVREATAILDGGLRAVLSSYGQVIPHGSYALDLMVWRDLDIYLAADDPQVGPFFQLGKNIAELLSPHRMHFRNEFVGETPHLPRGLYWGIHLPDWKIDVWAVAPDDVARLTEYEHYVAHALTPETRSAIMTIKSAVYKHHDYRKTFSAKDIYDAVLARGVRDLAGFRSYIAQSGVTIT